LGERTLLLKDYLKLILSVTKNLQLEKNHRRKDYINTYPEQFNGGKKGEKGKEKYETHA
jgi:hypothetical protein